MKILEVIVDFECGLALPDGRVEQWATSIVSDCLKGSQVEDCKSIHIGSEGLLSAISLAAKELQLNDEQLYYVFDGKRIDCKNGSPDTVEWDSPQSDIILELVTL
ncbi:hypothetical protein [Vibrio owensii]|uniref:hypothetical protein n=1 Tax=Vibrio owensii TaxID=696485 RepID=UPI003CC6652A